MKTILLLAALFAAAPALSQTHNNTVEEGADKLLVMRGKDPVSYFQPGGPVEGKAELKAEYDGGTYRFASEENRTLFVAAPAKYAPQYGGHCSNGMAYAIGGSRGENHRIIDGKLYLFGGEKSRAYFEMDLEKNRRLADGYWAAEYHGKGDWREISRKRSRWGGRVDHYKTNRELAAEYEEYLKKQGKK
jgi:YHS domain-containing protein